MGDPMTCCHSGLYWYAAPADERGWRCADCGWQPGEEPGFSPEHDRSHLRTKVRCIVHDLHEASIIYVSNSDCGERLTDIAADHCREHRLYDSVSIARVVLELEGDAKHAKFWRDRGEGIIAGKDPRNRCWCGNLAHQWCNQNGGQHACSNEHMKIAIGNGPGAGDA